MQMNKFFWHGVCPTLAVCVTALSGWLTVTFMYSIGQSVGSPVTTAVIGGVLDVIKCVSPAFVLLFIARRKYVAFTFALAISLALSFVSFAASVASLESGIVASQQNSASHQRIAKQIELYTQQVVELRNLASVQQRSKQVTKSQKTLDEVNALLAKIDSLSDKQANTTSATTVDKYGMYISYIAAAALELTSWLLVMVSSTVKHTQTHSNTVAAVECVRDLSACDDEPIQVNTLKNSDAVVAHSDTVAMNDNEFERTVENTVEHAATHTDNSEVDKCNAQLCMEIKRAILDRTVKPSHRSISERFGHVGRDVIRHVLNELHETGLLRSYRNGFTLAV